MDLVVSCRLIDFLLGCGALPDASMVLERDVAFVVALLWPLVLVVVALLRLLEL